jgi:outer membrane biosynthesis protein TonB
MPRNEEGEFELVLGNRQLLSVFLIVVVLLGIFFAMGYIVARYSYPSSATEVVERDASPGTPIVVDPAPGGEAPKKPLQPGQAEVSSSSTPPEPAARTGAPEAAPPRPAPEPPKTAESRPPSPPKTAESKLPPPAAPQPAPAKSKEPPKPAAGAAGTPDGLYATPGAGGTFIQVGAVGKTDAELIASSLRKRGYPAVIANGPPETPGIFRVLVGPLHDSATIAKTRAELQAAGFKGAYVRKY